MGDEPGYYQHLIFNAPLSTTRADAITARLAAAEPVTVLDVGCGWGELLLRVLASTPPARGTGTDIDEGLLVRANAAARARGLADRVVFTNLDTRDISEPSDLVMCVGSSHAVGDGLTRALARLARLTRPGGRMLFGYGTWEPHGPVDESLVWEDIRHLPDLPGLIDAALQLGLRPLYVETANRDEWDAFESGYLADAEEWLHTHHDHPDAPRVRKRTDEHRRRWLRGYRNGMGFAYLTLGVPPSTD